MQKGTFFVSPYILHTLQYKSYYHNMNTNIFFLYVYRWLKYPAIKDDVFIEHSVNTLSFGSTVILAVHIYIYVNTYHT